jgi:hypothetical protein
MSDENMQPVTEVHPEHVASFSLERHAASLAESNMMLVTTTPWVSDVLHALTRYLYMEV